MQSACGYFIFLLLILLSSSLPQQETVVLRCKFRLIQDYSCLATELESSKENVTISKIDGIHDENKSNDLISALVVKGQMISFLPTNVASFFPKLLRYEVKNSSLQEIKRSDFKDLSQLDTLILTYNSIKVLPSDVFEDLIHLRNLRLSGNKISQMNYKTFLKPVMLEVLVLDNNQMSYIHENLLIALTNLKEVHLQHNGIQELREDTFAKNQKLELIDVRHNKLSSIAPNLLSQLGSIKVMNFSDNVCISETYTTVEQLTEQFRNQCFPPYLKGYEEKIDSLKNEVQSLNETCIKTTEKLDEIKASYLSCQSNLTNAKFENSSLETEKEKCITSLTTSEGKLETCNSNQVKIENNLAEAQKKLTVCNEEIRGFLQRSEFINKTMTEVLNESKQCKVELTSITSAINTNDDYKAEKIRELQNKINDLESDKASLTMKLKARDDELMATNNEIHELKAQKAKLGIDNQKLLQVLKEKTNNDHLPAELTRCQQDYEKVYDEITNLSAVCSRKDEDLKLCMQQMPLCNSFSIDCIFQMKNTDYMCVANHVMACQPGMKLFKISGTHEYERSNFDVSTLEIRDSLFHFTKDIFDSLPSLRTIKVINSGLSTLHPKIKSNQLKKLEIEGNKFAEVPGEIFSEIQELEVLHLDSNGIEELFQNSFKNLVHLLELRLENNKISRLPAGVFADLKELRSLSLRKNMLTSLDGSVLSTMSMLELVRFDENRSLRIIDVSFLDHHKFLTTMDFRNTCVGDDYYDIIRTKERIAINCNNNGISRQ